MPHRRKRVRLLREMSCVVDPEKGGWSGVAFPVRAVNSVDITSR
jgi:hypothetical protein